MDEMEGKKRRESEEEIGREGSSEGEGGREGERSTACWSE